MEDNEVGAGFYTLRAASGFDRRRWWWFEVKIERPQVAPFFWRNLPHVFPARTDQKLVIALASFIYSVNDMDALTYSESLKVPDQVQWLSALLYSD